MYTAFSFYCFKKLFAQIRDLETLYIRIVLFLRTFCLRKLTIEPFSSIGYNQYLETCRTKVAAVSSVGIRIEQKLLKLFSNSEEKLYNVLLAKKIYPIQRILLAF